MKMKVAVIDKTGKKVSDFEIKLSEDVRDDIFKKAVISESSMFKQRTGSDPQAGKKQVINVSKRRRKLRTTYGRGGSRTPRKVMWGRGTQFRFVGAWASNTVGGRRAHPPRAEKVIYKDMNNKEWTKALRSGFTASMNNELVLANGQEVPKTYPMILDDSIEKIAKTSEFVEFLDKLGFSNEVERISERKIKAGRGTMRNRSYKVKRGPLVVVSSLEAPLLKAVRNVRGFDIITPDLIMVSDFGMSEKPGRAVLFTKAALTEFNEVFE
ncbi:MAG: 50S ribosomal protein L4 [Nanoarchaeota archaeon]|nr:50S ribosomal protein L4 [Nanoarchaeota archaeon]